MEPPRPTTSPLFDVYLRLRPSFNPNAERFLEGDETHVTIKPPASDHRKRAIERFGFTRVFDEAASQRDVFDTTTLLPMLKGVLAPEGKGGKDGLLATLGVTGSGKSHTILGTKTQRGLAQMTLDVLFRSVGTCLVDPSFALYEVAAVDVSEAALVTAAGFLDSIYGESDSRAPSRAATPMTVSKASSAHDAPASKTIRKSPSKFWNAPWVPGAWPSRDVDPVQEKREPHDNERSKNVSFPPQAKFRSIRPVTGFAKVTRSVAKFRHGEMKEISANTNAVHYPTLPSGNASKRNVSRPDALPMQPTVDDVQIECDNQAEYALVVSMYEVYNDRIFDLLTGTGIQSKTPAKDVRRRPLLFKSTEYSPDRKVVAGLKKVICGSLEQALLVLETGLLERRVAGTGSNAVSSRSHGFFCVEVKKKTAAPRGGMWSGNTLTVVDLAGSERARTAKTAGPTLAEAGKINESLMYLGQCMQMQSDNSTLEHLQSQNQHQPASTTHLRAPALVPFRQCKLTELLFSNAAQQPLRPGARSAQRGVMIVTADPCGDFNATSQILRYSALAREVTVPRIPSVTSQIMSAQAQGGQDEPVPSQSVNSNNAPNDESSNRDAALQTEIEVLHHRLAEEVQRRVDAETSWSVAEQRLAETEAAVREECWDAFEKRLDVERGRWLAAWDEERDAGGRLVDEKVGILMKSAYDGEGDGGHEIGAGGVKVFEDGNEARVRELEAENAMLRGRVERNEREVGGRTPSGRKLKGLKGRRWFVEGEEGENADPFA